MAATVTKRQERAKLVADARAILDKAGADKRDPTAEEQASFDAIMTDVDRLKGEVDAEERDAAKKRLEAAEAEVKKPQGRRSEPARPSAAAQPQLDERAARVLKKLERRTAEHGRLYAARSTDAYRSAFRSWCRGGPKAWGRDERRAVSEVRALQADAELVGGYLIPPIQFVNKLILFLKDLVFVRQLATIIPVTNAQSLGVPSLDADPTDADWTSEIATGNEDTQMAFGRRDLTPHPLAKRIKLSNKLLRLASNVESLVMDRLGYKFAITQEKAFFTGSGAQQPLGMFIATSLGIDTTRDVSTGNTTTAVTADGLINAKYSLKAQYQMSPTTAWMFHRTTVQQIRKLKDANGQYLWAPGLAGGAPDTVLEKPFYMSEYVPNTYTTGLYVGIIGDFSFYWIADALSMAMQRLDELYAETNQTGFIARMELDAMPVLAEPFIRVKLA